MKTHSLWNDKTTQPLPPVREDFYTDVLIIGGGMTGLSALYHLSGTDLKVTLVEQNVCGRGVTSKSTAKITYLQDNTIMNISDFLTEDEACKYLQSQIEGMHLLTSIIAKEHIDCDLEKVTSYLFTNSKKNAKKLVELKGLLERCGVHAKEPSILPFEEPFCAALSVDDTYVFHPLKYVDSLKEKYRKHIYENSVVTSIEKRGNEYISSIEDYHITSKYVVLALHYPYFLIPYLFPLKSHIEVSYLGAKKVENSKNFSAINLDKPTKSLRYHEDGKDNYMIYLYDSPISANVSNIKKHFQTLQNGKDFDYLWSNNDIITADYMPYVGSLSKSDPSFLIATGYNTWGMTNGTLAGKIISDIVLERPNRYAELFDPKRGLNLAKIVRFPLDTACSLLSYMKSTPSNSNNEKVHYEKINGITVAIYIDDEGQKHAVKNACPHLKCGLILNETERTWDCLCHGSRYDLDGHVIEGPSNEDITFHLDK